MSIKRGLTALLALMLLLLPVCASAELEARFIDVGQGDSCLITCDGESMLIDGGTADNSSRLVAILRELGIDGLRYMINTHPHDDHVGGLCGPLKIIRVDAVYSNTADYDVNYFASYKRIISEKGMELNTLAAGDELELGGARIYVLAPRETLERANDNSIVLKVVYGSTSMLFTGDAGDAEERSLMDADADLDADLLKVGHHGSESSSGEEFLEQVSPDWAIISVGEDNDFGHPNAATLRRLRNTGARILRTDENGDILVKSDGRSLTVSAERKFDAITDGERVEAYYIGNKNSKKFHSPDCGTLPAEKNRVKFETREQALEQGFSPCGNCKP